MAVHAFSLNRGELRLFQVRPEGWRPGAGHFHGLVLKAAADGGGPPVGTRVVALCDWEGWCERAVVPGHRMAPIADGVSFGAAASLPVAGLTALRALRHGAPLLGKRVLITGAAGGVGNLAVQLAARSGARVTAVVGSADRGKIIDGAWRRRDRHRHPRVTGPVRIDPRSRPAARHCPRRSRRVAHRGVVVVFGNSSGEPTAISFRDFRRAPERPHSGVSHYFHHSEPEERFGPDLALLAGLVANGSLAPRIVEYDWRELPRIGPLLAGRQIPGKAIFTIPQTRGRN